MDRAVEALSTSIHDIRAYLLALRPRRFEGVGLVEGMQRLLAEYRANTRMAVEFHAEPEAEGQLTPEAQSALFYIAQEALSNAARHSRATRLEVRLCEEPDAVGFRIRDNGRGLPPEGEARPGGGHGLRNIRERAQAMGGEARVLQPPEGGTEVRVLLPKRAR